MHGSHKTPDDGKLKVVLNQTTQETFRWKLTPEEMTAVLKDYIEKTIGRELTKSFSFYLSSPSHDDYDWLYGFNVSITETKTENLLKEP